MQPMGRVAESHHLPAQTKHWLGLTPSTSAALIPGCPGTQEEAEEQEVGYIYTCTPEGFSACYKIAGFPFTSDFIFNCLDNLPVAQKSNNISRAGA